MTIIESLTHLTDAKLILNDEIEDPELRRRWREDLGHGISQISITRRDFYARFTDRSHGFDELPAVAPGGPDTFCINLRTLSTHLRHLHLEQARISAALFWPGADEKKQASVPSWPHLETLLIQLEPVDSYGRFYADPTPEEVAYNASHNELRPWDPIEHREDDTGFAAKLELYENHVNGGKRKDGRLRWSWYITPAMRLADDLLEAWGLQWDEVEIWEEEGDREEDNGLWTAEALIPWR
ncbi:hypothetical protein DBV05_g7554 [Lasiodiplodia theobromae]|uniref:Uncharacterized protein n=1 Tax=Lasiodiplodia theobromae TaxID=45133 RepID=A0A5N5D8V6_9PEZI|nr:hypothetical protein DBV05_g7554 [Lasiodiplodia theobromae]